jgi:hypothetical protein
MRNRYDRRTRAQRRRERQGWLAFWAFVLLGFPAAMTVAFALGQVLAANWHHF